VKYIDVNGASRRPNKPPPKKDAIIDHRVLLIQKTPVGTAPVVTQPHSLGAPDAPKTIPSSRISTVATTAALDFLLVRK
jgi:hypothetical protein